MKTDKKTNHRNKIILGLDKAYEKLLEFKKQNHTELIIMRDSKIVRIKPE